MADNIFYIDPLYIEYRKMWKNDRWKFSGKMVQLTIKQKKFGQLESHEQRAMDTMNRIVAENGGNWLQGFPSIYY